MSVELEQRARSYIENGNVFGLHALLTNGELSVHSITRDYFDTLLSISIHEEQADICSFLLEHGSPVVLSDAVVAGTASWPSQDQGMQVFRAICSRMDLTLYPPYTIFASEVTFLTPWVLEWLTFNYIDDIPRQKAEFLGLSLIMSAYEWSDALSLVYEEDSTLNSARDYLEKNNTLVKKLINSGADIHKTNDYGHTALVVIVGNYPIDQTQFYFEKWAELLRETGVDIEQYLLAESKLCPTSFPSICPDESDRKLSFYHGKSPTVTAEWWTDPACSSFHALDEFKNLGCTTPVLRIGFNQCTDCIEERLDYSWPFRYALQHLHDYDAKVGLTSCNGLCTRYHLVGETRFERRQKRKDDKQARITGIRKLAKIPGSWID